ncbi:hypothetical protein SAMN05216338_10612 [Bradyrhizobium sp. Rc2d]|nr:hypothetical protein SAMN05216338_10612 [Bradyrhizobium sp. Rc2d]
MRCCMGPGSAAHRRRGAALRTGHESPSRIAIQIAHTVSRSRGTSCPSFASIIALEDAEGAGKAGRRLAPAVRCAQMRWKQMHSGIQGSLDIPAFPAQWFYGLCRDLPGERCTIAPVALRMADVAGPVGPHASPQHLAHRPRAPGPHDFAVRRLHPSCARGVRSRSAPPCKPPARGAARVHHLPSRVRDDRDPPLGPG